MEVKKAALKGLRVIELGNLIGAPFCGTLMAEFGAEVIKVEEPEGGDIGRYTGQVVDGTSLYFAFLARNKKCITLDLRVPKGQEIFKKLASHADVMIENFRPGTLKKWNIDYAELSKINRRLILAHVSGFGQYGPYRDRVSFDRIATAFAGQDYITGFPDKPPAHVGGSVADYLTGLFCTVGVMFAAYHRDVNGGQGQEIDLALYEGMFRVMNQVEEYGQFATIPIRTGNTNPQFVPAETFMTQDGQWVVVHAGTENIWKRLIKHMGREDLAENPKFRDPRSRNENRDELHGIVREWVKGFESKPLLDSLWGAGIPSTKINNIADIFQDPQFQVRENIIEALLSSGRKIKTMGVIPKLSMTPGRVDFVAPPMGAHNEEIYRGLLKLSAEEYDGLKKQGVI
ncbi:MAG: CoA transferase [Deltaproteobacteria bacterium]|nr:CoA transferase [Deltaproteobacteria bacterium]